MRCFVLVARLEPVLCFYHDGYLTFDHQPYVRPHLPASCTKASASCSPLPHAHTLCACEEAGPRARVCSFHQVSLLLSSGAFALVFKRLLLVLLVAYVVVAISSTAPVSACLANCLGCVYLGLCLSCAVSILGFVYPGLCLSWAQQCAHTRLTAKGAQVREHLRNLCQSPSPAPSAAYDVQPASTHATDVMETLVKPRIKGALRDAILAACHPLPPSTALHAQDAQADQANAAGGCCFKLMSADFILDDHLDVQLLGLNDMPDLHMPYCKVSSSAVTFLS